MSHPFGDLVSQHLHRKHSLSQAKLAEGILQAPAVVSAMCKGKRLTGPQARERVVAIIAWLHEQGTLDTFDEANALLNAAGMAALNGRHEGEAHLAASLRTTHGLKRSLSIGLAQQRNNLPAQLTRFIGRAQQVAEIRALLGQNRLVTLTGSGGVGKTRLALEVARQMAAFSEETATLEDGVCWVEFAALADPALVPHSVVTALDISAGAGRPLADVLADYLRDKALLLTLDNCEHLIEACAELAESLLRACPRLTILAASREPLGVAGEAVYRVPSLTFPDPQQTQRQGQLPAEQLIEYEAVQLFLERAGGSRHALALTPGNAKAVAQICQRLDGIPLAIELAAARTSLLPVEQIAARLDDRFALLTSGSRTALPRHKTLRALIDWSYNLLSADEQTLLRRLSVFAGGWTLEAADAILDFGFSIDDSNRTDAPSIENCVDVLEQLVNKSLVIAQDGDATQPRYRMLETVRAYARERLRASGEEAATRDRHLAYFLRLAERAEPELRATDQVAWLDRLEAELDNVRAALAWSLEEGDEDEQHVISGLRLATALMWLWHVRDYKREGSDWLERALAIEASMNGQAPRSPERIQIRARALNAEAWLLGMQRLYAKRYPLADESLALLRTLDDPDKRSVAFASSLTDTGWAFGNAYDREHARRMEEACMALYREAGDKFGMSESLQNLGGIAFTAGDPERARSLYEAELVLRTEIGDKDGLGTVYLNLGYVAFLYEGDLAKAAHMFEKSLALYIDVRNKWGESEASTVLGEVALATGAYEPAERRYQRALALGHDIDDKDSIARLHARLGRLSRSQGDYQQAAVHIEQQLTIYRQLDNPSMVAEALFELGRVALAQGEREQATQRFEEMLTISHEIGGKDKFLTANALWGLGQAAQARKDFAAAHALHRDALEIRHGLNEKSTLADSLDALAVVAAGQRRFQRATRLFGAGEKLYELIRFQLSPYERDLHDHALAAARADMGEAGFEAAFAEGRAMTLDRAVEYALVDE